MATGNLGPFDIKRIACHLNERSLRNRNGRPFSIKTVHEILSRTAYIGRHYFNKGREKRQSEVKNLRQKLREIDRGFENLLAAVEKHGLKCEGPVVARISKLTQERKNQIRLIAERQLNAPTVDLSPAKLEAFAVAIRLKLTNGPVEFRKQYLRTFVDRIEVDDSEVRILGLQSTLAGALAASPDAEQGFGAQFCTELASPRRGREIPALRTVRAFRLIKDPSANIG